MSTGKIELSVGAVKYVDPNEIITEAEYNYIKNKVPELDERVGVIEDEIEEINSSLDGRVGVIEDEIEEINSSLDDMTIDFDKETVLITSFNGVNGTKLDMYLTNDGVNLFPLHFNKLIKANFSDIDVKRDFSIIKHNGYYYLAYGTNIKKNDSYVDVIGFAKTNDFIEFDTWYYEVDRHSKVYAPQFYKENNSVYILVSLDVDGKMKQHYIKASDYNLKSFEQPKEIVTSIAEATIDASIYNELGKLHLFIKKEDSGYLTHFTSDILSIENANWVFVQDLKFSTTEKGVFYTDLSEGGSLVKLNGVYHFYACKFAEEKTGVITSTDLVNWSEPRIVKNDFGIRTKHFDTLKLDKEDKKVIQNFIIKNSGNSIFSLWNKYLKPWYTVLNLEDYVVDGVFTPKLGIDNALYVTGEHLVINHISTDTYSNKYYVPTNHYLLNTIKIVVFNTGSVTFKNQVDINGLPYIKAIICPNLKDYIISSDNFNTEGIIELERATWSDKFYRIKSAVNLNHLKDNEPIILRRSFGEAETINSSDYVKIPCLSYDIKNDKNTLIEFNGTISLRNIGDTSKTIRVIAVFGDLPTNRLEMYEVYSSGNERITLPITEFKHCNKNNATLNIFINTNGTDVHVYRFKGVIKRTSVDGVKEIARNNYEEW